MSDEFVGTFLGKNATGRPTVRIRLDAETGNVTAGGVGRGGDVVVTDDKGTPVIWLDAGGAELSGNTPITPEQMGKEFAVVAAGPDGTVRLGGHGRKGAIVLRNGESKVLARLRTSEGGGDLYLNNADGQMVIALRAVEGGAAGAWIGGNDQTGWVTVRNKATKDTVSLGGETGDLYLRKADGQFTIALRAVEGGVAGTWIGGFDQEGQIVVRNKQTKDVAYVGGEHGLLELRDKSGATQIQLKAETGAGRFGGPGVNGDLLVFSSAATSQASDQAAVWIKGDAGDIVLRNADCAEEFDIAPGAVADAGTVLVVDENGLLSPTAQPYDRSVAGVVSGGHGMRPGIILGHRPGEEHRRLPVALAGRVGCRVDADFAPIEVGDMLTTSATCGHAMKAADPSRAFGAVVGKALGRLRSGRAVIPILVSLQ
jgi:hypothetical protein